MEPLTYSIANATAATGIPRSGIYRLLAEGLLSAVKNGRRTLVTADSLKRHMASLPAATFRAPKAVAT